MKQDETETGRKEDILREGMTRRDFLAVSGVSALALSLNLLSIRTSAAQTAGDAYPYRSWEDLYRRQWTWDRVVKGTHTYANCTGACAFNLYIKGGIVWREEQVADYPLPKGNLPDYNPRGCQKGACYSALMYNGNRIKYPLKRVGSRGEGRWQRISWDEALTEIADRMIDAIRQHGPESIVNFYGSNLGFEAGASSMAKLRFMDLIGAVFCDTFGGAGDSCTGAAATYGSSNFDGTSNDWFHSDYLLLWNFNPVYTRIPEAHFLWEARYNGAQVISIAPDYNASSIHADLWVNPRVGTDAALALGMAQVILSEGLHNVRYLKEQTDLPFLLRQDTRRFLREEDLETGGKDDVFYLWDARANRLRKASKTSLDLGEVDPALEGSWEVTLAGGRKVRARTVLDHLKEALESYTPERASRITGVHADVIRRLARDYARARAALILSSMGSAKFYHADLMHRGRALLAALAGHTGKAGGGHRTIGLILLEGQIAFAHPVSTRTGKYKFVPGALWWYVHGGLREVAGKKEFGDRSMRRAGVDDYVRESVEKGWMPLWPPDGQAPKILVDCGGNISRRVRANHLLAKHLWPKLDLLVDINCRMDSTALQADLVLPAAGYYEKTGFKYTLVYVPFLHFGDRAVPPLYEAKDEWDIFKLLAQKVEQRAREKGFTRYTDALGVSRDLSRLDHDFTDGGRFETPEAVHAYILANSGPTKGHTLQGMKEKGYALFATTGGAMGTHRDEPLLRDDQAIIPCQRHVLAKEPWPTLTGRQQFYIDQDWYLDFREELPVHKDPPLAGGSYPLRITGGHTRWSIHSIWRDDPYMLRLQRGLPVLYMSFEDAGKRGIRDHDTVRVYNDVNSFRIHAKLSPTIRPGQVVVYHAWEPFQYEGRRSHQVVMPSPLKPLSLVGGYGHLGYRFVDQQPNQIDRDTVVEVEKA